MTRAKRKFPAGQSHRCPVAKSLLAVAPSPLRKTHPQAAAPSLAKQSRYCPLIRNVVLGGRTIAHSLSLNGSLEALTTLRLSITFFFNSRAFASLPLARNFRFWAVAPSPRTVSYHQNISLWVDAPSPYAIGNFFFNFIFVLSL